jgi:pilus assembly protein CpaF
MGMDEDGRFLGRLKATGFRPHFIDRLEEQGIELAANLFEPEPFVARAR